jgi:hypothetical protein
MEVPLPDPPLDHPPALVLGATDDLIVDVQALEETALLYGVDPIILDDSAHDVMLVRSCPLWTCSRNRYPLLGR